jgi:hypothetical protein
MPNPSAVQRVACGSCPAGSGDAATSGATGIGGGGVGCAIRCDGSGAGGAGCAARCGGAAGAGAGVGSRAVWRRGAAGRFEAGADRGSASGGALGSAFMMLTAGIELAEGKSSLAEPGAPGAAGTDDRPGVRSPAPLVVSGAGADAVAVAPEPHASACAPIEASNTRDFILATTCVGSRNSRSSAQSAPLQPRVVRT